MRMRNMLLGFFLPVIISAEPTMLALTEPSFPCSKQDVDQYCVNHGTSALAKDVLKGDAKMLSALPNEVKEQLHELFDKEGRSCVKRLWLTTAVSTSCFLYGLSNFLWASTYGEHTSFSVLPDRSALIAAGFGAYTWSMLSYYSGCLPEYDAASRKLAKKYNR